MNQLSGIKFYQLSKKRPQGIKKTKWIRRTANEDIEFIEKVKVIRMKAEIINRKLVNY